MIALSWRDPAVHGNFCTAPLASPLSEAPVTTAAATATGAKDLNVKGPFLRRGDVLFGIRSYSLGTLWETRLDNPTGFPNC